MADNNGHELSDEMLEEIAGGVLTDAAKETISVSLSLSKESGLSLEEAVSSFMRGHSCGGMPQDELLSYSNQIWEMLP